MSTPDIDYEALARRAWVLRLGYETEHWENDVRAVVAALREQGFVLARRGLLEIDRTELDMHEDINGGSVFWREVQEIDKILGGPD